MSPQLLHNTKGNMKIVY